MCLSVLLCNRSVDTLGPNRLHILNQYDQEGSTGHSFSRKVTSEQVTEENATPLMLFYGKILYYRVCSLMEMDGVKINLGFTQFQCNDSPLIPKNCPETDLPQVKQLPELSDPPGVRIPPIVTSRSRE